MPCAPDPGQTNYELPRDAGNVGHVDATEWIPPRVVDGLLVSVAVDIRVHLYASRGPADVVLIKTDSGRQYVQEDLSLYRDRGIKGHRVLMVLQRCTAVVNVEKPEPL